MKKLLLFGTSLVVFSSLLFPEVTALVLLAGMVKREFPHTIVSPQPSPNNESCPDVLCHQEKGKIICNQVVPVGVTTISQINLEANHTVDIVPMQNSYFNKTRNITSIFWEKGHEPSLHRNFAGKSISLVINYVTKEDLKTAVKFLITMNYCNTVLKNKCKENIAIPYEIVSKGERRACEILAERAGLDLASTNIIYPIIFGSLVGALIILLALLKLLGYLNKKNEVNQVNLANGAGRLLLEDNNEDVELRTISSP